MTPLTKHWRDDLIHTPRATTNKILEMVDNGLVNARDILLMALKWMSEDEVEAMAKANELLTEATEDEEN